MTGATGLIARQLLPTFADRYDVVQVDVTNTHRDGYVVEGISIVDLIDSDRRKYESYFEDVDAVVHLGYKRRVGDPIDHFSVEIDNIKMAYNVMRCAYDAGVRRVVVASSNHAADYYENALIHERKLEMLDPYELPLSDGFYGWAKASYEHLGFVFACGFPGFEEVQEVRQLVGFEASRKLQVVMIRIGAPREIEVGDHDDLARYKRDLGAWVSERDLAQLFERAIEAPNIENEHGIPWQVVYGISNNTRAFWSLSNARNVLKYDPQDDSEVKYADDIRSFLTGDGAAGRVGS